MCKNRGFIVEEVKAKIVKTLFEKTSIHAYADEGEENNEGEENKPTINYEDLIAKARKEEKEKQYKTIDKLKNQNDALTNQHNDDLIIIADLEKQVSEANDKLLKSKDGDSEEVKSLKAEVKKLTESKKALEDEVNKFKEIPPVNRDELAKEIRDELEAEYEVKSYKLEKMTELKDDILVPELVFGSTKEEIDANIQIALDRSKQIKESLGVGKRTLPKTPSNPSINNIQDNNISLERLATMDVRSSEYAELRKQLGLH